MKLHRALLSCAAAAGGVLAVVLLPAGVAIADGTWVLTPDIDTFAATQADGFPPLFEHATGTELVDVKDVTLSADFGKPEFNDTHTVFGSFTNDDFAVQSGISFAVGSDSLHLPAGTEIDVA